MQGPEEGWQEAIERACAEHPDHAAEVRRRFGRLRNLGLDREAGSAGPQGERQGERFGDFRLIEMLGSGGMGVVYLAEQESPRRRVALKLVRGGGFAFPSARRRFAREVEAASKLDHPHICAVYEAGEVAGQPYIAMRYVEGESLEERIAKAAARAAEGNDSGSTGWASRRELDRVLELFEKIAGALHAAHEAGLVHRDVKPGNIMVARDGEPVILDFGLARLADSDLGTLTRSSTSLGTPAYMAPEQIAGSAHDVDQRADVYALGVTLYEVLTLRRPFEAPTREELYRRILTASSTDPRRANRAVSNELKVVLATAMEKDPARRYQSAHELAQELRRLRAREPIRARPAGPLLRTRRWVQRNPLGAALIATFALGLAISLVLLRLVSVERRQARALALASASAHALASDPMLAALLAREALRLQPSVDSRSALFATLPELHEHRALLHSDLLASAVFSPDGEHILTACMDGNAYLWSPDGSVLRVFGPHDGQVRSALFSPDGGRIVTGTDREVVLWDGDGRFLAELGSGGIAWGYDSYVASNSAAFSPDGSLLCVGYRSGAVRVFDRAGEALLELERAHASTVVCVAFSAASESLATGGRDGRAVVRERSGDVVQTFEHGGTVISAAFSADGRTLLTSAADGTARTWDLASGALERIFEGHGGAVSSAAFSADETLVLTASEDHTARLWRRDGSELARMGGHAGSVWTARFSPDGAHVLSCANGGSVLVHDLEGRLAYALCGHDVNASSAAYSADGRRILSASWDGTARLWELDLEDFAVLRGHRLAVRGAAFSPSGDRIATVSHDRTGAVWSRAGELLARFEGAREFLCVAWTPEGDRILSGDSDGTVRSWSRDGAELASHGLASERIESLVACSGSAAPRVLVGAYGSRAAGIWILRPEGPEQEASFASRGPVAVAPGRRLAAVGSSLWTLEGELLDRLTADTWVRAANSIGGATFSADGQRLALVTPAGRGSIHDVSHDELRELAVFEQPRGARAVDFAPGGDLLATASADGIVRFWSARGEELLRVDTGKLVWSVDFAPDGKHVLAALSDGTVHVWSAAVEDLLELADARITRGFRADEVAAHGKLLPGVVANEALMPKPAARSEPPGSLNAAAWAVVREPGRSAEEFSSALALARRAVELSPRSAAYRNTLGVALYRAGNAAEAVAVLSAADGQNREEGRYDRALDLLFLAMSRERLGQSEEARRLLDEERARLGNGAEGELRAFLAEAEALLDAAPP